MFKNKNNNVLKLKQIKLSTIQYKKSIFLFEFIIIKKKTKIYLIVIKLT